jgi:acyl dehydratase
MNEMNGYHIEDLRPGMQARFSKTITEADIVLFAGVSGDNNAAHVNEEFAAGAPFDGRIAHGFLTASVISAAVANYLPGPCAVLIVAEPSHAEVKPATLFTRTAGCGLLPRRRLVPGRPRTYEGD